MKWYQDPKVNSEGLMVNKEAAKTTEAAGGARAKAMRTLEELRKGWPHIAGWAAVGILVSLGFGLAATADFDGDGIKNWKDWEWKDLLSPFDNSAGGEAAQANAASGGGTAEAPTETPPPETKAAGVKTTPAPPPDQPAGKQEVVKAPPETPAAEKVIGSYTLSDGDGITQGLMKLKAELGDQAPEWLKKLNTPAEYAQWAADNGWYAPGEERDSVVMHKGDVLRINALNELTIHTADGSFEARTDVEGRAGPEALGTRNFSDTVPTKGAPDAVPELIPAEYSDAERTTLLTSTAKLGPNLEIGDFATKENEFAPGSEEYKAWEYIKKFLEKHSVHLGEGWKTSSMDPTDFFKHIGVIR